ncbi:MAG TPA: YHS domain-containing (seleno)protein [Usitatibacteraceae bacterium]|nr:YHS domain-containing (seleno)protein [Usitatibacteraceae bacterium]
MKRLIAPAIAAAALLLGGCAPLVTQSPGQGLSPVNAVADGDDKHLILFGHDVVSYFTDGRHAMGSPAHKSVHKGVTFRFASAEHKKLFDAAPEKYVPQFGGYCANGIVYGIPWGGDADTWRIIDGKLYIFGGAGSRDAFLVDERANLALAQKYWKEEVEGANAFFQRAKRLVLRVPHYKSGQQLAEEVARAKGGK